MKKIIALLLLVLVKNTLAQWPHENISQAVFAKSVEDRAPIEIVTEANDSLGKIYFFTNIRHLTGDKITHRWLYKGKVKAEISFDIKGERWRVWSSKNLWHTWTGQWKVEVVNQQNELLLTKIFEFGKSTL
ncbi:MAG: DUF2914 domain-containing protein [Gammaproteobacteria bacterium]|nr:MAG: DUF2914 domain-containing protein [Gammaproteobacteria bacterium]